ncbi:Putative Carbohydrate esterase family 5 protein [[Torrubiella] hemipterigena]|uniref:Putative Carbohydrate esterase family 5 protein n=1 Tax=[Torrubiella] hemipterigena TaxID=1531966 RepID=A0A0A1T7X7_9HYPO|nr:Putative Carbohydrate esterase family 5 protein [[Torrubiella] hemipterigena]
MFPLNPIILTTATLAGGAYAAAISSRARCSSYTLIDVRGTGEVQGPSAGFLTMNANILGAIPGGKTVSRMDFKAHVSIG